MPLPLPNLDTRRWGDLVDEARALVPRYAPSWTDYNAQDPGITLLELLAYLVEQDVYRANRVPERHVRKFLALTGVELEPPRAARVALSVTPAPATGLLKLPAGTTVAGTVGDALPVRFRTTTRLEAADVAIAAVQTWDGRTYTDVTHLWRERVPIDPIGAAPSGFGTDDPPALLIGFDGELSAGRSVSLWLAFAGGGDAVAECRRVRDEARLRADECRRLAPRLHCDGGAEHPAEQPVLPAPALAVVWELYDGGAWQALGAVDETYGMTQDSVVRLRVRQPTQAARIGNAPDELHWIRCRAAGGEPDEPPELLALEVNAVIAEQRTAATGRLGLSHGARIPAPPLQVGQRERLLITLDPDRRVDSIERTSDVAAAKARVLALGPDELEATLVLAGVGNGLPGQRFLLPAAAAADGMVALWSVESGRASSWEQRADFDAAGPRQRVFALDAQRGELRFGDGERGSVPPADEPFFAVYDATDGSRGNLAEASTWSLVDGGASPGLALSIVSAGSASGGADAETVVQATGRAAERLWAHELLLELAAGAVTLDGLDPHAVRSRPAPQRATTTLDFERLALDVPGRRVRRTRAWAGLDPAIPCFAAPGTVSVVVVNGYPPDRPQPSPSLLAAVDEYLRRRKTVGTRLVVSGPDYVEVTVTAGVLALPGADAVALRGRVLDALRRFLDPLVGGPNGRGWPFGRDVYRAELLALVDGVNGVDAVEQLTLVAAGEDAGCNNVCVGPAQLVVSGTHAVEVRGASC